LAKHGHLISRDAGRVGRAHTGGDTVRRSYSQYRWSDWQADARALVVDNSDLSAVQVTELVEAELVQQAGSDCRS
jgi:hypothetical protein